LHPPINTFKQKLIQTIFKNSVHTAKKTQHFTMTKINWLTLFKEIITVCTENRTKPINIKYRVIDCWSRWYILLPLGFWRGNYFHSLVWECHASVMFPDKFCDSTLKQGNNFRSFPIHKILSVNVLSITDRCTNKQMVKCQLG
jgi:hypothetical protein